MTTNGVLLAEHAQALYEAGLHRVTVSLDTLRPERFILPDGTVFGVIASTTSPFCWTCDRSRLTAEAPRS